MSGSKNLTHLLSSMEPVLRDGVFVFASMQAEDVPDTARPVMQFREAEGTTLILEKSDAEAHGLNYEFACRMITLNIHSSLDAVGFLAAITTHLARLDMGVNPVAGFYHDHLFIAENRADDAMMALKELAETHKKA